MSTLEHALTDLAAHVEFPPTPDFTGAIQARPPARRRFWRRPLVVALAVLVVAAGAVFAASSEARNTLLDWFGISGVLIERVPQLDVVPRRTVIPFGRPTTLSVARELADFPVRLPHLEGLGPPNRVFLDSNVPGSLVTLLYGRPWDPRLVLSEWRANTEVYFYKLISYSTEAKRVRVNGGPGLWVSGAQHSIFYRSRDGSTGSTPVYLAGNVLVWMEGPISHRLEADLSLPEALTIARSLE